MDVLPPPDTSPSDRPPSDPLLSDPLRSDRLPSDPPLATSVRRARRRRPGRRRRRGFLLAGVVVAVVAWGAVVALHLERADRSLRAGMTSAQRVRNELSAQDLTRDTAAADMAAASGSFTAAHAEVRSLWLAPLHVVPVIGTQIRSVEDLSGAAQVITTSGRTTLATVHTILAAEPATPEARAGDVRLLAVAVAALEAKVSRVSLGPDHDLIGALVTKRDTFSNDLTTLQNGLVKAGGVTAALADVMTGPRTYLIAATNNAEMRAGSGMILQAGTLDVRAGRLTLGPVDPTSLLVARSTPVRPSGDLAARWGFENPAVDFRELLLSPQFAPNAALAAQMWQQRTGQHVDGVLTVDVAAVADLLTVTGPVTVDGTTFTSSSVTQQLLVDQYAHLGTAGANDARHEKLGQLAAKVFMAVENDQISITALARAFGTAVDGRHLQVWAAAPSVEKDWTAAGVAGSIQGDGILLSLLNQGANKLDPYQQISSALTTTPGPGGTAVTVTVTVHNATPATLTGYPAGGAAGDPPARQYSGAVALEFPRSAGAVAASGGPIEAEGRDYGASTLAVTVAIPQGHSQTVIFRFRLAGSSGSLEVVPSARLPATTWSWTQLGAAPEPAVEHFSDSTGRYLSW
jgi:hypothetical protein